MNLRRFIPAGAGNTPETRVKYKLSAVYPRWRGEHNNHFITNCTPIGLSPLARGTLLFDSDLTHLRRFIPAGAGNTCEGESTRRRSPVYPRWRGEHLLTGRSADVFTGLSPLARGTPKHPRAALTSRRFIPAGAGNTPAASFYSSFPPVYPRWRGEHTHQEDGRFSLCGLSPLARGTLHR